MKESFVWYVDAVLSKRGYQTAHVATVVVLQGVMMCGPFYRIGVAVKHPNDKLPFVSKDGRALAAKRAAESEPVFTVPDVCEQVSKILSRDVRDTRTLFAIDSQKLISRIQYVLNKFSGGER